MKILLLKQDSKFLLNLKKNFPNINFEISDLEFGFDEEKFLESAKKLKKNPHQICIDIALEKAKFLESNKTKNEEKTMFLGLFSKIFVGKRILTNPKSNFEALRQINLLSGRRNKIFSSFCLVFQSKIHNKENSVIVKFKHLDKSEINNYIEKNHWGGEFGIYSLQSPEASKFITFLNGSYQCGLDHIPIFELNGVLNQYF